MWIALTLAYYLGAILAHGAVARNKPAGNRVTQFVIVGGVLGACLLSHLVLRPGAAGPAVLAGALVYAFLCELYIFLFTFVTSSVSVALLIAQLDGPGATDEAPTLAPGEMVGRRLRDMAGAGLLTETDGRFALQPRARLMVRFHRALRDFFRHEVTSEFQP